MNGDERGLMHHNILGVNVCAVTVAETFLAP